MTFLRASLLLAVLCAMAGCKMDYGQKLGDELGEEIPDTVVRGFRHSIVRKGSVLLTIEADRGESFESTRTMKLSGVSFAEHDPATGEAVSRGTSDSAILKTDTEDAEFSGNIKMSSTREGFTIRSGYLSWKAEGKKLESRPDMETILDKSDGSRVRGTGFRADARSRGYAFSGTVRGVYVNDEAGKADE